MVFIPTLFLKAFLSMAFEHIGSFISVLLVLFLLTVPLGYLIITAFKLFRESSFFDRILLSFGIGLGTVISLSLWTMLIKFDIFLILSEIVLIGFLLFGYSWRKKLFFTETLQKQHQGCYLNFLVFCFLGIMFFYYSLVPLTTDLAIFRDYDLIAWGIQENSALVKPIYNVETYYPPGSSLITALINQAIPQINIPKIMLNLAYFFAFYIFILFYEIGNLGFNNKYLGLFFMLAWAISPVSRNFVTDGATISGNTAAISGLVCLLFILFYFQTQQKKYLLFAGLALGAAAVSHADTLIVFLWCILALTLSKLIIRRHELAKTGFFFFSLAVVSLVVASPFLLHAMKGRAELSKLWTDSVWESYSKGEIHPKPLSEIMFFSGRWLFWMSLLGIPYILCLVLKLKDWKKPVMFSLLIWPALMFASNNFTFLRLMKPILLFYAINIIMWFGIAIPVTLIVGFGLEGVRKQLIRYKNLSILFFILLLLVVFIKIVDYETVNKENVFDTQQGFFMQSFAQRNGIYNDGDINLINWLKNQEFDGWILNPDGWASFALPVITKKNATSIFVNNFYDSIDGVNLVWPKVAEAKQAFDNPLGQFDALLKKNISYIFIPSGFSVNKTMLESYQLVKRDSGAKILAPNLYSNLKHYEIEDYTPEGKRGYSMAWFIDIKTIELSQCNKISIPVKDIDKTKNLFTVYIKHLTFLIPLSFEVKVGEKQFIIDKTTSKLTWSESSLNLTREELEKADWKIEITGISKGIDLKIKRYLPEIDWIEIEPV